MTSTELSVLCDDLERHDREMTPAPWKPEREEHGGSVCIVPDDGNPESTWLVAVMSGGDLPNGDQNIDGVAFLRNNAARIASELRRLMRVEATVRAAEEDRECRGKSTVTGDRWDRIIAALRGDP